MDVSAAQHGDHEGRAGHVEGHPGQHPLCGRVEDLQLGEQETEADDDADGGESGQDALHVIAPSVNPRFRHAAACLWHQATIA